MRLSVIKLEVQSIESISDPRIPNPFIYDPYARGPGRLHYAYSQPIRKLSITLPLKQPLTLFF